MRNILSLFTLPLLAHGHAVRRAISAAKPNLATVKNSCTYDVYLETVGPLYAWKKPIVKIAAGGEHSEELFINASGGPSLKVRKSPDPNGPPMQFEYTAGNGDIWYNLSLIDCVGKQGGCAGHDGGLRAVAGNGCRVFECKPNADCSKGTNGAEGYMISEFEGKPGAPVGKCAEREGVAFELCSGTS